jgi:hypothetical protein
LALRHQAVGQSARRQRLPRLNRLDCSAAIEEFGRPEIAQVIKGRGLVAGDKTGILDAALCAGEEIQGGREVAAPIGGIPLPHAFLWIGRSRSRNEGQSKESDDAEA